MSRKINLGGERARELKERSRARAREDREYFLEHLPTELVRKEFGLQPTSEKEVANVIRMDSGYTFTEYKSEAKLSVPFERGLGLKRPLVQTLPDIFEVTEIVYSGVGPEDLDDDSEIAERPVRTCDLNRSTQHIR